MMTAVKIRHNICNGVFDRTSACCWRLAADAINDVSVRVHHSSGHFGTTDVDAYGGPQR
jgi:hypothetical protein